MFAGAPHLLPHCTHASPHHPLPSSRIPSPSVFSHFSHPLPSAGVPEALPKFLQSVRWDDAPSVEEAHRMLLLWRPPSPMQALELLQADFADPTVRCVEHDV